jgi:sarcosine oxidase subunit beta
MLGEAVTVTDKLNRRVSEESMAGIARTFQLRFPRLSQVAILRGWAIPVAFTGDNQPLFGKVDRFKNLYIAAGLKSTIVLAPILGETMADLICGRNTDPRLAAFSPSRSL